MINCCWIFGSSIEDLLLLSLLFFILRAEMRSGFFSPNQTFDLQSLPWHFPCSCLHKVQVPRAPGTALGEFPVSGQKTQMCSAPSVPQTSLHSGAEQSHHPLLLSTKGFQEFQGIPGQLCWIQPSTDWSLEHPQPPHFPSLTASRTLFLSSFTTTFCSQLFPPAQWCCFVCSASCGVVCPCSSPHVMWFRAFFAIHLPMFQTLAQLSIQTIQGQREAKKKNLSADVQPLT